ncbi:DUF4350 domain-containing protein [Vulcanisaeta thermophila]|uniref:DUF4350 domain-containing protein n=1 Tax=Vulcanisaeta thermophila TaxID=867917 RepID=UPI000852E3FC|nr:DUF4350 domain-containing protein [Vulcanisaeta thermophila]
MKPSLYITASVIITLTLLITVLLGPSTTPFDVSNPYWNGYSTASTLCHVKPIYGLNQVGNVDILIVIPTMKPTASIIRALANYAAGGGTLLILSNGAMYGNDVLQLMGINASITSGVITDPVFNIINEYFPLARTPSGLVLALDNASALIIGSTPVSVIAETNAFSRVGNSTGPFIVAAEFGYGGGKVIVITTPSIFMNSMIKLGDNEEFLKQLCGNHTVGLLEPLLGGEPLSSFRVLLMDSWLEVSHYPINYVIAALPVLLLIIMLLIRTIGRA